MILIYKFNVDYKNNTKKIFIEALEQRIMLDGAGASTFLDIIDDRNQDKFLQKNSKKITNFSENKIDDQSQKLPFDQVTRDQKRNERKQVVFIDSQVQDYQTLINAFNEDTEVYLIQSNEDGFKKIDTVLKDNCDVSSLHIIGHGSAGKILFGNATLSNDTIQSYNQTLRSIGQCLTEDGDILFYGCNVASTEGGKTLINKISEITKADIAASDDVTGKSGDWKLENKVGNIETKNISQTDYQHDLTMYRTASAATTAAEVTVGADGITSIKGAMAAFTGTADRNAFDFKSSRDHNPGNSGLYQDYYLTYNSGTFGTGNNSHSDKVHRFTVVLEQTGITSGSFEARRPDHPGSYNGGGATTNNLTESQWEHSMHNIDINTTDSADYKLSATAPNSTTGPLDVYMVALDSHFGNNSDRYNKIAEVVFDREIVGILIDSDQTVKASSNTGNVDLHNSNNSTYPDPLNNSNRGFETIQWRYFRNNYNNGQWGYGTSTSGDWFAVGGTDNRTLHVAAKNTGGGDYARILVKGEVANNAPVARNDVGVISEDGTLTVDNSDNANVSGSYDATGEHSGDVLQTSSTSHYDTDADSDTLVVASVRTGGTEGSGSAGTLGSALTGTYGQLTLNANGSYTYVANQSAADDLDAGDSVTDVFNYTVSDGNGGTDTATITITVLGTNDAPVAQNDVGYIQEGKTLTVTNGANANVSGSYDATGEHSGDVINTSSGSHSDSDADADSASLVVSAIRTGGSEGSGTAGTLGQSLSGTYGALTMNANGSYTYVSTANSVSGTVTDVFNYTLSDGTATDIATLTITIYNSNDPVAANNTGVINEDGTLSVSDGASANSITTAAASHDSSPFDVSSQEDEPRGLTFNYDGTKMFVVGWEGDDVNEYTLSTAWDVSTASFVDAQSSGDADARDVKFNTDGTKMFVLGRGDDKVYEFSLSTGYDVSTASSVDAFSVTGQEEDANGLAFNLDGTKMYVVGQDADYVNEYNLSTGFDVSTAAYAGDSERFLVSSQESVPIDLDFNSDGTRMFVVGFSGNDINEYTLSTAFDVSTASFVDTFSVNSQDTDPSALAFSSDGSKMFVVGDIGKDVNEYSLVSPYNLINVTGEHDGDVLGDDSDSDSDTMTVASYRTGSSEGSGTAASSVGSALTGTYGQLTLNSNGSYSYVANQSAADDLDAGDVVTDSFNYTVQDGNGGTDTATIVINSYWC